MNPGKMLSEWAAAKLRMSVELPKIKMQRGYFFAFDCYTMCLSALQNVYYNFNIICAHSFICRKYN